MLVTKRYLPHTWSPLTDLPHPLICSLDCQSPVVQLPGLEQLSKEQEGEERWGGGKRGILYGP